MKIVLIPDKFKGSLSAKEVINALRSGIIQARPEAEIFSIVASDGGDGFLEAIQEKIPMQKLYCEALDPLGRKIKAPYLYDSNKQIAYIELASCSGLKLLNPKEQDPLETSTLGTGIQIAEAISQGAKTIYMGLGGSATNDGGIGIAHALGYRFLDKNGNTLHPVAKNLESINYIEDKAVIDTVKNTKFIAVNDVTNVLLGPNGAASIYGPQKGAGKEEVAQLEKGLSHLDLLVRQKWQLTSADIPGAGAAGGVAYGLNVFFGGTFIQGIQFMLKTLDVASIFKRHQIDLVITGEGKIDKQTLEGKLIQGVIGLAKSYNTPVIAICGVSELNTKNAQDFGLEAILEIRDSSRDIAYSIRNATSLLQKTIYEYLSDL